MSTCMGNEEWEPDPREVQCTGGFVTTGATPTSVVVQYPSGRLYGYLKHDFSNVQQSTLRTSHTKRLYERSTNILYKNVLFWISYCWNQCKNMLGEWGMGIGNIHNEK